MSIHVHFVMVVLFISLSIYDTYLIIIINICDTLLITIMVKSSMQETQKNQENPEKEKGDTS